MKPLRVPGFVWPLIPITVVSLLVEALVRFGVIEAFLLPTPSSVLRSLQSDAAELAAATFSTALSAVLGFALSLGLGFGTAGILALSASARRLFYPYAIFFQTVPIIAIAPLLVIWFGYGRSSVVASSFIVSVFPIVTASLTGLRSTDRGLLDLFRVYRATPMQIFFRLRLPAALPFVLGGMQSAAGLAIIGAIVGEFISGNGLGSVIDVARTQYRVDKVFASVGLASLLGLAAFYAMRLLSRSLLKSWHPSEIAD